MKNQSTSTMMPELRRTTSTRFPSAAKRPGYSALANARLAELGLDIMPDWRTGLTRYLHATHEAAYI